MVLGQGEWFGALGTLAWQQEVFAPCRGCSSCEVLEVRWLTKEPLQSPLENLLSAQGIKELDAASPVLQTLR